MKSAVLILSCVFFSITLNAQDTQIQKKHEKRDLVKELNMTPDQEKAYLQLKEKRRNSVKELNENIVTLRKEMNKLMDEENCTKDQVFSYIDKIGNLKNQIQKERIEFMFAMKDVLSAEQYAQMKRIGKENGKTTYKNKKGSGYYRSAPENNFKR